MNKDETIVFRVFEYGFRHAESNREIISESNIYAMTFPEPKVVFLYSDKDIPDVYRLHITFPTKL